MARRGYASELGGGVQGGGDADCSISEVAGGGGGQEAAVERRAWSVEEATMSRLQR